MLQINKLPENFFTEFESLRSAVIDASSIIYMQKAGFLPTAMKYIQMHAPQDVINETGFACLSMIQHKVDSCITADQKVVFLAQKLLVPVISEDKAVLNNAFHKNLQYYNSIMVLNYLLYKRFVTKEDFDIYKNKMLEFARYSKFVVSYAETVTNEIIVKKTSKIE